jgi:hypothetical protein
VGEAHDYGEPPGVRLVTVGAARRELVGECHAPEIAMLNLLDKRCLGGVVSAHGRDTEHGFEGVSWVERLGCKFVILPRPTLCYSIPQVGILLHLRRKR